MEQLFLGRRLRIDQQISIAGLPTDLDRTERIASWRNDMIVPNDADDPQRNRLFSGDHFSAAREAA
jgi:hypothetical protein